ncbi:hypothetical protein FHY11_000305 [Xanthomonas arboricola]|uniref:hypothetical protein n=1 Tax=Xanthomonas euroxanthea TaxID=2259622 RepID=UPI00141AFA5D|nr:hypothetical protein [Xanthomonas euroxanthea]NIK06839.1 hypothetical protein [Xanthomonas euroxanthea]
MTAPVFPIEPSSIRFIKLGRGGAWEQLSIKQRQVLCFGFDSADPTQLQLMRDGDWGAVRHGWVDKNRGGSFPTYAANALKACFEDDGTTLWVTFYAGDLYWCFLEPGEPIALPESSKEYSYRKVRGAWSNLDCNGRVLSRRTLSGAINSASRVQGATHLLTAHKRLLQRLNGQSPKSVEDVEAAHKALVDTVKPLIGELTWQDFEVLADLITTASGWRRNNQRGGVEKTIDLDLELPLTGEIAFAQIKATSKQAELDSYIEQATEREGVKMFYIHNSAHELQTDVRDVYVIGRNRLAELIVRLGFVGWLMEKAR